MDLDLWIFAGFVVFAGGLLFAARALVSLDPILDQEGNVLGYRRLWLPIAWFLLGAIGSVAVNRLSVRFQPPLKPVAAPAFQNFKGCRPPYLDTSPRFLSLSCVDYRYELDASYAYKIGLPAQGRGNRWYRVGNDAYLVNCGLACRILEHRPAIFYQPDAHSDLQRPRD